MKLIGRPDRLREIADAIERSRASDLEFDGQAFHFDMSITFDYRSCGTAACVAGFACMLFDPEFVRSGASGSFMDRAAELLELGGLARADLFIPLDLDFHAITRHELTPAAIRWMADNDCADWRQAFINVGANPSDIDL